MVGETVSGIAEIQRGLEGCRAANVEMDRPFHLALLAEAYLCGAKPNEALSALDEAFAMVRDSRAFFYEAELYRLRGNALRQAGDEFLQAADTSLQHALEVARRYGTHPLELRAAVSLARLWREQGKHREARELLSDVSAKFTGASSTPDLVEAHAILKELGAGARTLRADSSL